MSERSIRPTLSGSQLQRRAESAAAGLAATVLRLNHYGDAAESSLAELGDLPHVPTASTLATPVEELEGIAALRRELAADFAELMLENFDVELDAGEVEIVEVSFGDEEGIEPISTMPPRASLERLVQESPLLEEG
jgi:hypothetical protein